MITVVGASLAGLTTARELRTLGHDGPITFIGAERWLPYDRPPLSKTVLTDADDAPVAPAPGNTGLLMDGEADDFTWHVGVAATGLAVADDGIVVECGTDGPIGPSDAVIVATGARARGLIGDHLDGVHVLRSLDDAHALRRELSTARHVVLIGGGFVGAEIASTAAGLGADVVIVEATETPGAAVLGADVARWAMTLHARAGVRLLTGAAVDTLVEDDDGEGRIRAVRLGDGSELEADVVVIGIGAVPETAWAAESGIAIDDGFVTDSVGATSMPNVYAAGDCARSHDPFTGTHVRRQHWTSAVTQARAVAHHIVGVPQPPSRSPYFWSDQYGHRIQVCGHIPLGIAPTVLDGTLDEGVDGFLAVFGDVEAPLAIVAADRPRDFLRRRKALDSRTAALVTR